MFKGLCRYCLAILLAVLTLSACKKTMEDTQHSIETESYKLSVHGHRLRHQQSYNFPTDSFHRTGNDTACLIDDVKGAAYRIDYLSDGIGIPGTSYLPKGSYELTLELVHKPGSDHAANFRAALGNLRDWGYITLRTAHWKRIAIVRKGTAFVDSLNTHSVMFEPYSIDMSEELFNDTASFGEWLSKWYYPSRTTHERMFKDLDKIGYDTIQQGDFIVVDPIVRWRYRQTF